MANYRIGRTQLPDEIRPRSVLVFSRDPGPTNLLIALVERLSSAASEDELEGIATLRQKIDRSHATIMARDPGVRMWQQAGFSPTSWRDRSKEAARRLLLDSEAAFVLTGSSDVDEFGDRDLWQAARSLGLESHVVIDHPANLRTRFNDREGNPLWPDYLYVADYDFAERLVKIGHERSRVRVIGDLHHARLKRRAVDVKDADIANLRRGWGADEKTHVILFASECAREMLIAGCPSQYDEIAVLEDLLGTLENGETPGPVRANPDDVLVVIRPHPRDAAGKYDEIASGYAGCLRVIVSGEAGVELAILSSDVVVGMNSSFLYEAYELKRPVVSLTGHIIADGKSCAG